MWTCNLTGNPAEAKLAELAAAFAQRNADCALTWHPAVRGLEPAAGLRVAFVQRGAAQARIGDEASELSVGDLAILPDGQGLELDLELGLLVFAVPGEAPEDAPACVRPDHDPRLTDTPGGCAEETDAYRRILLTWSQAVGPYTCQTINAHRVRMHDSFSHYHPVDGGFEELYLVQHAPEGARLHWSPDVEAIERSDDLPEAQARGLVRSLPLTQDQLVYLPRGTMHRAVGGALAQVITVPGFVPQREVGLDHHLRRLQERFAFTGADALPFRAASSGGAVIK